MMSKDPKNLGTNKLFAAVLVALFVERGSGILGASLVCPEFLKHPAYLIEGVSSGEGAGASIPAQEVESIDALVATADAGKGQGIARKCQACHTFGKAEPHRVGPALHGVFGQKIASQKGYPYSKALAQKEASWDSEALNSYLYKPRSFAPGTKMSFAGLEKAQDRADVIAYLKSLSGPA